jgi:hypothetical protein
VEADSFTVVVEAEVIMISEHVGLQDKQSVWHPSFCFADTEKWPKTA